MNNDLAQFSEERLKQMVKFCETSIHGLPKHFEASEVAALARIALSAKQDKPDYFIVSRLLTDGYGTHVELDVYLEHLDASKCKDDHGGVIIPVYTTPQPDNIEQEDCHWYPDEDLVYSTNCGNEWQFTEGGLDDNQIKFCPYCGSKIVALKLESK